MPAAYADLRKSIDGLVMIVQNQLKLDPFDKALFVFCNKKIFGVSSEKIDTNQLSFFNEAEK
ncbi:IS66 family insertion sequence element accessory protein TnpB, partial [uncultured Clostridium sp.]|uniref:IS66 family insertion sequence element accessory protein TnpB n=1 Tax=uncultured Clostridium sp. TaxID=59620 RepID=UPI00345409F9